jgi:2-iminoacetate synthase ThiH
MGMPVDTVERGEFYIEAEYIKDQSDQEVEQKLKILQQSGMGFHTGMAAAVLDQPNIDAANELFNLLTRYL